MNSKSVLNGKMERKANVCNQPLELGKNKQRIKVSVEIYKSLTLDKTAKNCNGTNIPNATISLQ